MEPVILTHGLSRMYGRRVGVDNVDLSVPEGTLFGFLGPNGAGKTTTIRRLLAFLRASAEEARMRDPGHWTWAAGAEHQVGGGCCLMDALTWVTARPDGSLLCVGSETGRFTLWSVRDGSASWTFETGEFIVRARWTADGARLLLATLDDHVLVRSADGRKSLGEIRAQGRRGRTRRLAPLP